jgi:excisionase family DNA binding protein
MSDPTIPQDGAGKLPGGATPSVTHLVAARRYTQAEQEQRLSRLVTVPEAAIRAGLPMFLTVDETAALLRTTRKAIYAMIERGQLPGVTRIGRRRLLSSADLLDWLHQKRAPWPGA